MSISARVREQILNSFRAELKDHIQTMTDGLLALEHESVSDEDRREVLDKIFRAAHSLKGAARSVGVTMVEQLAHALEDILDALRNDKLKPQAELFTVCYHALDAIQDVQAAYESGKTTPPAQALQVLADLEAFKAEKDAGKSLAPASKEPSVVESETEDIGVDPSTDSTELSPPASPARESPAAAPTTSSDSAPVAKLLDDTDEMIRVRVSKLDALMAQLSELLVTKIRAEQRLNQLSQFSDEMAAWQKEWLGVRSAYGRLLRRSSESQAVEEEGQDLEQVLSYTDTSQERLQEMNALISSLVREYNNDTMHMSLVIDELEEEIKRVRMLPLSTITASFGRMVRDLAHNSGKEAMLRIVGGDTELDKRVLEQIKDPLIHLIRNAVDHGIETPEQREAAGKYRIGTITLFAEQMGNDVIISVSDDGRGLDLEAIRASVARHQDAEYAQMLNETELLESIFTVGVSTSQVVTDISGRGVGLDIVRRRVEALHGIIDIDWAPAKGTTFTLKLPLTLSSSRGLLVYVAGERFAIPLNAIEHITTVKHDEVVTLGGDDAVRYNGHPVTLVHLSDVLGLPRANGSKGSDELLIVILAAVERRMAFVVDELLTEQEIVIKALGKQLQRVKGVSGATVMGSGEVVLILNVSDLIRMALRGQHRPVFVTSSEATPKLVQHTRRRILVVDDSITTRTLEKNILEAAGFIVQLATDGQEAWELIASTELPELVVSDVAMPHLDGIGLTRRIKQDARTAALPVILVTSLDSAQDKARGIEAGADAYITKGTFDQTTLLETVEQLI